MDAVTVEEDGPILLIGVNRPEAHNLWNLEVIQAVIEQGQAEGVFRSELDARFASWVVYGGLEEILTGWVMGRLPDGDEEVARAERTILDVVCGGLAPRPVAV